MIFSEIYSVYYTAVARILDQAMNPRITAGELEDCVRQTAFSESVLTILPALKTGKWPLLDDELHSVLEHSPTMPMTLLEKRWLKAISMDPRVALFGVSFPELKDVSPLFTREDYRIFDQYGDGDPYDDPNYQQNFRRVRFAIQQGLPLEITMKNRYGKTLRFRCRPKGLEYSRKDDKFRILVDFCRYRQINLARVISCQYDHTPGPWCIRPKPDPLCQLTLCITDERNALERAMLHFSHFERQAERLENNQYLLRLKYMESDETELVIRVLSFGPYVQVVEPESFVERIRERLQAQMSCGLR